MTALLALAIDLVILGIARNPGKPFRVLQPSIGGVIVVGILIFPVCLIIATLIVPHGG